MASHGRGPSRGVWLQVRRSGLGWVHCRHRYSDFVRLRAALLDFLPGLELPPLPAKQLANRLGATVVSSRAQLLGDFLQWVLDHPILATSDALVAFLQWPEAVLPALYARARGCYETPAPSAQRRAMTRVWNLRRERADTSGSRSAASRASMDSASRNSFTSQTSTVTREDASSASRATPLASSHASIGSPAPSHNRTRDSVDDGAEPPLVRKASNFADALAAAMVTTVEDSARRLQARARAMPTASARSSRLTEDLDEPTTTTSVPSETPRSNWGAAGSRSELESYAGREASSGSRVAAAAAGVGAGAGAGVDLAAVVLQKLETIELRLHRIESSHQQRHFWNLFCCAAPGV